MSTELPELPDLPEIPEEALISDPSQFPALNSPVRMRILKAARQPVSVREIAEKLSMPVTRLYHHINMLADAGFIEVVHTRKSGARLEKLYRVAGKVITPSSELIDNVEDPRAAARAMASIVIGPARVEAESALRRRFEGEDLTLEMGRSMAVLTPDEAKELAIEIRAITKAKMDERHEANDPDARPYAFTFTLLPSELT